MISVNAALQKSGHIASWAKGHWDCTRGSFILPNVKYWPLIVNSDRLPEMADYSYISVPRHCGGSHTLTYPFRRYGRLQQFAQCMPPLHADEGTMMAMMKV